jgi:hypothetical protein
VGCKRNCMSYNPAVGSYAQSGYMAFKRLISVHVCSGSRLASWSSFGLDLLKALPTLNQRLAVNLLCYLGPPAERVRGWSPHIHQAQVLLGSIPVKCRLCSGKDIGAVGCARGEWPNAVQAVSSPWPLLMLPPLLSPLHTASLSWRERWFLDKAHPCPNFRYSRLSTPPPLAAPVFY